MLAELPKLGNIVTTAAHPYFKDLTDIIISGEHQLTPPLMVIAEILKNAQTRFDEKTGEQISQAGSANCKCIWFSQKAGQFEEVWLSERFLKHVEVNEDGILGSAIKKGDQVVFKTADLELGKKKSILNYDESSVVQKKEEKANINAYLAFVSPVLDVIQVIDAKEIETKDARFDIKTGDKRKLTSDWLLKVKWFNPGSEKFSEKILPACVFNLVQHVDELLLRDLSSQIQEAKQLYYEADEIGLTIITPLSLSYRAGKYYLKAFDYLLNTKREIEIKRGLMLPEAEDPFSKPVPTFSFIHEEKGEESSIADEIKEMLENAAVTKNYTRFEYRGAKGKVGWRTIKDCEVSAKRFGKDDEYYYFQGYCMTKKEIRTFKTSNVFGMQMLNVKYE